MPNIGAKTRDADELTMPTPAPMPRPSIAAHLSTINVVVSWTSNLVVTIGSFVVTPAILGALGEQTYGVWLLITSFVGQMRILDLGMTSGCMKFTAASYESGDRAGLRKVFNTSVAVFGCAAAIALLVTTCLSQFLPTQYAALKGYETIIFVTGLAFVIDLMCRPYSSSLRGRSFFFVYDSVEISTYLIFKLGLVLYFAHLGLSLRTLCMLTLGDAIVRNLIVIVCANRACNWTTQIAPSSVDKQMFKKLVTYSSAVFLINIADLFRFQIDSAVIGKFLSNDQIAVFGIGFRLIGIASTTIGVIGAILIPRFSGLYARGDRAGCLDLLRQANLATGMFTIFGLLNIGVFGHAFLHLWIKKPWIDDSYTVMMIGLPAYIVVLLQGPAGGMLSGIGKLKWQTIITFIEAGCNVALSIILVQRMGIFGVVLGTAIPMIIVRGIVFPFVVRHELGISIRDYWSMHARTAKLGAVYLLLISGFSLLTYSNFFELFGACAASALIFCALLWIWVPEATDFATKIVRKIRRMAF